MNLRLASSTDSRALAMRDHLLPLVRERGTLENQRGPVRRLGACVDSPSDAAIAGRVRAVASDAVTTGDRHLFLHGLRLPLARRMRFPYTV